MPKAASSPTTPKQNPDAALTEMIKRCSAAWRQSAKADVAAMNLRRSGSEDLADAKWRDQHNLSEEACALEQLIMSTRVHTARGYVAKCRAIAKISCDDIDLIIAAFILGRDAERLEIAGMPAFLQRRVDGPKNRFKTVAMIDAEREAAAR
jgi:hypothetical protein